MSLTDTRAGGAPLPEITLADLEEDPEIVRLRQQSMSARLRMSIVDMRQATRQLLDDRLTEARLLFFVLMSDVIFFLNFGVKFVLSPQADGFRDALPTSFAGAIGGVIALCFLVRTAALYLFSGVVTVVCRILGGRGTWLDTRAGIFWASLVAAPVGVVGSLIVVALGYLEPTYPILGEQMLQLPAHLIGIVAFVYFVSAAVAEAQQFRRTSPVFIAFSALSIGALVGVLALAGMVLDMLA